MLAGSHGLVSPNGGIYHKSQYVYASNSNQHAMFPNALVADQWHHLTFTYNGFDTVVYIDGAVLVTETGWNPSPNIECGDVYVGSRFGSNVFPGDLAGIRYWHGTALTVAQVILWKNFTQP